MITIYCLRDAEGCVRYVGKTCRELSQRLRAHMQRSRGTEVYHLQRWLRSLQIPPAIEALERCLPMHWEARERYWIALARDYGSDLVNTTEGGDARPNNFGRKATPEHCEKISRANKGRKKTAQHIENSRWSEERREIMRARHTGAGNPNFGKTGELCPNYGRKTTLEIRAKQRAAKLGKKMPPRSLAFKELMRARMSGENNPMFGRPSSFLGRRHSPEALARQRAARLGKKATPETCAKISAAGLGKKRSPETRAKMSAWQLGKKKTPEARENMRAAWLRRITRQEV